MDALTAAESGLSREAYGLLAQANLLRVRGHWPEAVDACRAALRLAPDSAAAHSLLGDIYENQGELDEAARWYQMALDSSPDSAADRMKLDRLRGAHDSVPAAPATVPPTTAAPERILRALAVAVGLTILLVAALAFAAARRQAVSPPREAEVKTAPVVVASAAGQAVPVRDGAEQALINALNTAPALSGRGLTVVEAQIDPRTGRDSLTVSLGTTALGRAGIERAALAAALAAEAAGGASDFTVRGVLPSPGGGTLVFVGDTARSVLPPAPADGSSPLDSLSDAQVDALFTNSWWALSVPS